ncbi:DNA-processing protein DprA [Caldicellulosiruptoraceae bacterium PP1]
MNIDILLTLINIKGVGEKTIKSFIEYCELKKIKIDDIVQLIEVIKITKINNKLNKLEIYEAYEKTKKIIEYCKNNKIEILDFNNHFYPKCFKNIYNAPLIIFYKGNIELLKDKYKKVAIVGTRVPNEKSKRFSFELSNILAKKDKVIVSGLALGCDTEAHKGCLHANGKTIAVLPCGLDKIYPDSNINLANEIIEKEGGLLSEYPIFSQINKGNFIARDRLQSALSDFVIVIQTNLSDGTMHTVRFAFQQFKKIIVAYHETGDENKANKYIVENFNGIVIENLDEILEIIK